MLHARQLGWLAVRPPSADGKPASTTRAQQHQQHTGAPHPLPLAPPHLLAWLHSVGLCVPGPAPLPATEIAAWAQASGVRLARWEFAALQEASRAFVDEFHAGRPVAPVPAFVPLKPSPNLRSKLKSMAAQINGKPNQITP